MIDNLKMACQHVLYTCCAQVFVRDWTKATVTMDCKSWHADIAMK